MLGVLLVKLLNTTGSINQFLLASKKRMTGRTDLNFNCLIYRTKLNFIATGTLGCNSMVCGMDIRSHATLSLQKQIRLMAIDNLQLTNFLYYLFYLFFKRFF